MDDGRGATAYFNEMYEGAQVRAPYAGLDGWSRDMPAELRSMKQSEAEALFRRIGITFAVYGEGGDPDRLIPFDMFPRVFSADEWRKLERGIKQRARALNAFLVDVYGRGEIVRARPHPRAAGLLQRGLRDGGGWASGRRAASTATSSASTSSAPARTSSSCSRTTAARPRASATCWRTARS